MSFSAAFLTAFSTAIVAAYGVDFLVPLNPEDPEDPQEIASPSLFVIVINVLLKVAVIYARPCSETITPAFFLVLTPDVFVFDLIGVDIFDPAFGGIDVFSTIFYFLSV